MIQIIMMRLIGPYLNMMIVIIWTMCKDTVCGNDKKMGIIMMMTMMMKIRRMNQIGNNESIF